MNCMPHESAPTAIASTAEPETQAPRHAPQVELWLDFWRHFRTSRGGLIGLTVLLALLLAAVLAPWLSPHSPTMQYRDALLLPPVWQERGVWRFVLGTDSLGRDMLSRLLFGARYSLMIGAVVVTISLLAGVSLGLLCGYFGRWLDTLTMRVMDVILSVPGLLLALGMVAVLGPGLMNAMLAIALVLVPHFVRLTRASVLAEKNKEYVIASRLVGAGHVRLMFNAILPNCLAPLIVQATLSFSEAILEAAALGFLGQGAQPPTPEWGAMLADAREFISSAWWVVTLPGLAILLTVLAINLVGDALRDALDPRLKRA